MPITAQEAWDATDPSHSDEDRERSASAIMAGVAANDAYYNSRSELEGLRALAQGDQVVSHSSLNDTPTQVGTDTPTAIEGTSTEEPEQGQISGAVSGTPDTGAAAAAGAPGAENPEASIAALRKQITDAGMNPAA